MEALQSLGIDLNGLVLYLVNFGLLALILTALVYKPLLKFIDERRETIKGNLEQAERLRSEFAQATEDQKQESDLLRREMQKEILEAKSMAEARSKDLLKEAEAQRERLLADAKQVISEMKARLQSDSEAEIKEKMEKVLLHVLANSVPETSVKESVDSAWKQLDAAV